MTQRLVMPELDGKLLLQTPADMVEMALAGLARQGRALDQAFRSAHAQLAVLDRLKGIKQIYLTGCGDSYFAALAARPAFERFTCLPAVAVEAMELAYFTMLNSGSLVILISSSGSQKQTLEAGRAARQSGAQVVGVTHTPGSRLAAEFPCLLVDPGIATGDPLGSMAMAIGNFSFSLAALYRIGLYLGMSRRLPGAAVEDIEAEIQRLPRAIERAASYGPRLREYMQQVSDTAGFYFLGAGSSYGSALFFQAKFFEQAQRPVFGAQMEEFAHQQMFLLRPGGDAQVWFVAPPGPVQGRALEIMHACAARGASVVLVTDVQDQPFLEHADAAYQVDLSLEFFSPLVTAPIGHLLGLFAFERWGGVLPSQNANILTMP